MKWKVGDWVVYNLAIGQIMEIRDGFEEFSDGSFRTSGALKDRFRPLTLRNKATVEYFDYYYNELRNINGNAGFNYPDIFSHFAWLALNAMDTDDDEAKPFYTQAQEFVRDARDYKPKIQDVDLFRTAA